MSINYMQNPLIVSLIAQGQTFQKSAQTALRKIRNDENGLTLITYVKDGGNIRKESESILNQGKVLAQNLNAIGQDENGYDIYNTWPISIETAIKNYGQEVIDGLSDRTFSLHRKKAILKAVVLTQDILDILGVKEDKLEIQVSWSEQPMIAHLGDYLAEGGYSVSAHDMKDYILIN